MIETLVTDNTDKLSDPRISQNIAQINVTYKASASTNHNSTQTFLCWIVQWRLNQKPGPDLPLWQVDWPWIRHLYRVEPLTKLTTKNDNFARQAVGFIAKARLPLWSLLLNLESLAEAGLACGVSSHSRLNSWPMPAQRPLRPQSVFWKNPQLQKFKETYFQSHSVNLQNPQPSK